LTAIFRDTNNS